MKKIASILLSLFMVLTLLPTTALAEGGDHNAHCICGATHTAVGDHTAETTLTGWQAVSEASQLTSINADGTYYLSADVTLNSKWTIPNDVNVTLCLNGKTLTASSTGTIDEFIEIHGTLTLTNCKDTGGKVTTGTIGSDKHFHVFMVRLAGTLNLYSGTIADIVHEAYGGGVHNQGTFNMYGGTITRNTAINGGGVFNNNNSIFNLYGGTISGNTRTETDKADGSDVHNYKNSTMNAYGGTVGGSVFNEKNGGSPTIAAPGESSTTFNGAVTSNGNITGGTFNGAVTNSGTISGGTFGGSVGNKRLSGTAGDAGTGTITGGTFTGAVTNSGTNVKIEGGTFNGSVENKSKATITGGTFNGSVDNKGISTSGNGGSGTITDGTFNGAVTNYGTVTGGTFGSSGSVTNEMDGSITGGTFNGTVTSAPDKISGATVNGTKVNRYEILGWDDITNDTAGCALDNDTNTLTLTNVYIDTLYVPRTEDITIKISGNVTINTLKYPEEESFPIDSRAVTRASTSAGSLTIEGKDSQATNTLYSDNMITSEGDVTIKNLTANVAVLSSAGSLNLVNSKVTVGDGSSQNSQIGANSITMTDPSVVKLNGAVIGAVGESETNNGLIGLKDFIPDGYKISAVPSPVARAAGSQPYTIVSNDDDAPATNITLQRHYNVTFDPNGGAWGGSTNAVTKRIPINTVLADYNDITEPAKGTDTFNGWFTAATGGDQVTTITADDTLYAQWNSAGGGDGSGGGAGGGGGSDSGGSGSDGGTGGGSDDQTGGGNNGGGSGNNGGTSRPHYVKKTDSTDANSAKTFDAGVAVYGVLAVSAVLGMGYVGKKRF